MPLVYLISFAFSSFLEKANHYLLPCPFKYLTGYDCPGCGFQRSFLALLKGNVQESFFLYPPTLPILLTFIIGLSSNYWWKGRNSRLLKVLFIVTASVITISYVYKLSVLRLH